MGELANAAKNAHNFSVEKGGAKKRKRQSRKKRKKEGESSCTF